MRPWTSRSPPPAAVVAATVLVTALLVGVQTARADIGIESVSRTGGVAGDRVDLLVGCGGCGPRTVLPISLLPTGDSPGRHPCRGTACATSAPAPPASDPYVPLGIAVPLHGGARLARGLGLEIPDSVRRHGPGAVREYVASANRLRFRIPDADPGLYTYVIFCCGHSPPEGGDLIGHPQRRGDRNRSRLAHALSDGEFLRIEAGVARPDESAGIPWPVWTAITVLGVLALKADTEHMAGISQLAFTGLRLFVATDEAQEGLRAFADKRTPEFGRHRERVSG